MDDEIQLPTINSWLGILWLAIVNYAWLVAIGLPLIVALLWRMRDPDRPRWDAFVVQAKKKQRDEKRWERSRARDEFWEAVHSDRRTDNRWGRCDRPRNLFWGIWWSWHHLKQLLK